MNYNENIENILNILKSDKQAVVLGNGSVAFTTFLINYNHKMFDTMRLLSKNFNNNNWLFNEKLNHILFRNKNYYNV